MQKNEAAMAIVRGAGGAKMTVEQVIDAMRRQFKMSASNGHTIRVLNWNVEHRVIQRDDTTTPYTFWA